MTSSNKPKRAKSPSTKDVNLSTYDGKPRKLNTKEIKTMENTKTTKDYSDKNAFVILANIDRCIEELEEASQTWHNCNYNRFRNKGYSGAKVFYIRSVCEELNIFDWWNDTLSMSQLKAMKKFVETATQLGFTGYTCFQVGAAGCSHGMWVSKETSTDGYSPDGDVLFHSFRSGDNYYDMQLDGQWMHDKYARFEHDCPDFNLKQIKAELAGEEVIL